MSSDLETRASKSETAVKEAKPTNAARSERDRRKHRRFRVALPGRYMLEDGEELLCECVDISAGGMRLRAPKAGPWGSRVIAYIEGVGRIEGRIVRRAPGWFAIETRATVRKEERVEGRIAGIVDGREGARKVSAAPAVSLETADGKRYVATLADLSLEGASLLVEADIVEDEAVWLNDRPGRVVQVFPGGLALEFVSEPARVRRA